MNDLSVIHVAGTKGKGSTCAFVEHVLRKCGTKTGLYSSPHLVDIRERFRIDGVPVSRTAFTRNFWWLRDKLRETGCEEEFGMPAYFRFLTLLGFRIFSQEGVECAVLEVGLGGRLDATNVVKAPVACGVTSLGMDHVEVLGDTIGKIAYEKAGIFKPSVPAFTSPQPEEAMESLRRRAREVGTSVSTVDGLESYERGAGGGEVALGLAGGHQRLNAALAIRLLREWGNSANPRPAWGEAAEAELSAGVLPERFRDGLRETEWAGRAQVVPDVTAVDDDGSGDKSEMAPNLLWYLDGAHTEESMRQCAEWFVSATKKDEEASGGSGGGSDGGGTPPASKPVRMLMFNCMEERDPETLLTPTARVLSEHDAPVCRPSIFVPSESSSLDLKPVSDPRESTAWQEKTARTWARLSLKYPRAVTPPPATTDAVAAARAAAAARGAAPATIPTVNIPSSAGGDSTRDLASVVVPCMRQAIERVRTRAAEERRLKSGRRVHVLVTGSLYLVGDMLRLLGRAC